MTETFNIYRNDGDVIVLCGGDLDHLDGALWVDVCNPSDETVKTLNGKFSIEIPTREEISRGARVPRFHVTNQAHVFTPKLLCESENNKFFNSPVVFVLSKDVLVTVREAMPTPFSMFERRVARRSIDSVDDPKQMFFELMGCLAEDYARKMEQVGDVLNQVSRDAFDEEIEGKSSDLIKVQIGRISESEYLNGRIMNSLIGLSILGDYFDTLSSLEYEVERRRFEANIESLMENGTFISDRIDFAVSAVMSAINLEQNQIVNVFSTVTIIFAPPTLMAGIWGMNFEHMPELAWPWGYAMALGIILLSAIAPYALARKLGLL